MKVEKFKVLLYLKKSGLDKSGKAPIMGRITVNQSKVQFSSKLSCTPSLWNPRESRLDGKSNEAVEINAKIDKLLLAVHSAFDSLLERKKPFDAESVKVLYQGSMDAQMTLLAFLNQHMEGLRARIGIDVAPTTLSTYVYTHRSLGNFIKKKFKMKDIAFGQLNEQFIREYQDFVLSEGYSMDTVRHYLAILKKICKIAFKEGISEKFHFAHYKLPKQKETTPKALSRESFEKIRDLEIPPKCPSTRFTRDLFLFACYTGTSYADVVRITRENLFTDEEGSLWLKYRRKKTDYRQFHYTEDFKEKEDAEKLFIRLKAYPSAQITKVERKTVHQAQPLLYDLTTLQKDCNIHLDLSAEKTLEIAQSLYEKKLISYPRTSSRYIPQDVFREIPSLLRMILRMDEFKHLAGDTDTLRPETRSVDDKKITDHHALIITGDYPHELSGTEKHVYRMIAGRMLEAFASKCEKESLLIEASFDGLLFRSRSQKILSPGWRNIFNYPEDKEEEEKGTDEDLAVFGEGETAKVGGHSLVQKKTMPKPLYTEATLLAAMETAGKTISDEALREAMKEQGLGTPATRAAIIETLFKREYMERSGKKLVPTEKGLFIYDAVKDMRIADVEMTGQWEKTLADIETEKGSPETFLKAIEVYTRQITEEVLSLKFPEQASNVLPCPKCGTGKVTLYAKLAKCNNEKCGLRVFRKCLNKELSDSHIRQLLSTGSTTLIKGFKGKKGNSFDASLVFDEKYDVTFAFPKTAGKGAKKGVSKPPVASSSKPKK